jgi:hypothetical protein
MARRCSGTPLIPTREQGTISLRLCASLPESDDKRLEWRKARRKETRRGLLGWSLDPLHTYMSSTPESWKNYPYDDPLRHWISVLVSHNGKLDLPSLARLWLHELANVGLQEIDRSSGAPPKEPASYYPRSEPLHSEVVPIKLEGSREVLWLKLNGRRSGRGYKRAEVLDTSMSTDRAILAALTALEAKETNTKELDESLIEREVDSSNKEWPEPGEESYKEIVQELVQAVDDGLVQALEEDMSEFRYAYDDPQVHTVRTLAYVVALLRYYRPEFDDLPREERVALAKEGCKRIAMFLEALRHLEAFLEYWAPERDLRSKVEDAARDIKAAELQDVERLNNVQLGKRLGIDPPPSEAVRRTNSTARDSAKRGRRLLKSTLGEEGWRKLVEDKRAQRDGYWSRSEEERSLLQFAENEGLSTEEARRLLDDISSEWESEE